MSDDDDDDDYEELCCGYCGAKDSCEHLLAVIDRSFWTAMAVMLVGALTNFLK